MASGKRIFFTVTNDLVYDQRMQRICGSLAESGYEVTLVGREMPGSPPLRPMPFKQVRIPVSFQKGKFFYLEYNFKLYRYLIKNQMDAICAIDLDTLLPVYLASNKKGIPRMYDAHEFFTEMIEVKRRPHINYAWKKLEEWLVPKFKNGYTVGKTIALDLNTLYGVQYQVIRNIPIYEPPRLQTDPPPPAIQQILDQFNRQCPKPGPFVFYQGALNEGRALLPMLEAMKSVPARMLMAGSGNMEAEVKKFIADHQLEDKVYLCGNISPDLLKHLTAKCFCGITLYDAFSKNQYYSLGNKFFDYMMAQKPQVCVNYPEYTAILQEHPFALPIPDVLPATISGALNNLLADGVLYSDLQNECKKASLVLNWEKESQILRRQWDAIW